MKAFLQKDIIPFLFLVAPCLSFFSVYAAEEGSSETKWPHHLALTGNEQEGHDITKADDKDSSSSVIIEILTPQEYQQRVTLSSDKSQLDKHQPIGWVCEENSGNTANIEGKSTIVHSDVFNESKNQASLMKIQILPIKKTNVVVVIDVFRAFTSACYILADLPASYMLTNKSVIISQQMSKLHNPFLIGKAEKGATLQYNIPNSPTRIKGVEITGRNVMHRTEGGACGILMVRGFDLILATSLVNADATVKYLSKLQNPLVTLLPMGHEGVTPSLEDDICAQYIEAQLRGRAVDLSQYHPILREGSGKYFFSEDQWQYPSQDFKLCLDVGRFNFAIHANVQDGYAILKHLGDIGAQ